MKLKFSLEVRTVITGHLTRNDTKGIHCDNCTHYSYHKYKDTREHMCLETGSIDIFMYPACHETLNGYSWRKL